MAFLKLVSFCLSVTATLAMLVDRPSLSRTTFRIEVGLPGLLVSRQTGTSPAPPPQCTTLCAPVTNFVSGGSSCTLSTCCTNTFVNTLFNCFECIGQAVNLTDYSSFQGSIDMIIDGCAENGIPLNKVTLPGQNPNRPLSTVAGGSTATGSSAATGSSTNTLSTNSASTPGSPIMSTISSPASISQSTITSVTSITQPQSTVTSPPTNPIPSPSPSPTGSSGIPTMSHSYTHYGLMFCFFLAYLLVPRL